MPTWINFTKTSNRHLVFDSVALTGDKKTLIISSDITHDMFVYAVYASRCLLSCVKCPGISDVILPEYSEDQYLPTVDVTESTFKQSLIY